MACSSKTTPSPAPPVPEVAPVTPDAAVPGITAIGSVDPNDVHLDDDATVPVPQVRTPRRVARRLEVLLRSSPPGAFATVDGVPVGPTPILWEGDFTGREREFTFTLVGHRVARYRFVPLSNGIVHGRLEENEIVPRGLLGTLPAAPRNMVVPVSPQPTVVVPMPPTPVAPPVVTPPTIAPPITAPYVAPSDAATVDDKPQAPDAAKAPIDTGVAPPR